MTNIFDAVPDTELVTIDQDVDYVEQLVGENKKFRDVQGLAKGKAEADRTIEVLKKKLDDATKELTTRTSLDSFLDQMKAPKEPAQPVVTPQGDGQSVALDDSALESKLADILARQETAKAAKTNFEQVIKTLTDQFGDQASLVINHKAKEMGMSVDSLKGLASQSPAAFYQLIGVAPGVNVDGPVVPRSGVNTLNQRQNANVKNNAYYEKMKRDNPAKYFAPETTSEMITSLRQLGSKYYE